MKIIKQQNRWSCSPCAFAMVLEESYETIVAEVGHDGSEIWWPELREPLRRRGFHLQEFFPSCLHREYAPVIIETMPASIPFGYPNQAREIDVNIDLNDMMSQYCGVLQGIGIKGIFHSVAWDTITIYDPNGTIYRHNNFDILLFVALIPIKGM